MNILLIDTTKKHFRVFVPLALLRLSARHKAQGDNVNLVMAGKRPRNRPDIIYFSFIFLFDYQSDVKWVLAYRKLYPEAKIIIGGVSLSLIQDKFEKWFAGKNIELFIGRDLELEKLTPDFGITGYDYSYGFTSRGCPNSCDWCVVPRLEGKVDKSFDWKTQIDARYKKFYGFDNNILACGSNHFREVLKYCHQSGIKIDFNQAMDAEIFHKNKKIQEVFLEYPKVWEVLRFAWDSDRVKDSVIFTLDFLHENKIRAKNHSLLMLYDADDSPEKVYDRVKLVKEHPMNISMKMMRFKDLDTGALLRKWGGIGDLWAQTLAWVVTGNISRAGLWDFLLAGDLSEFIKKATYMKEFQMKYPTNDTKRFIQFAKDKMK